MLVQLYEQEILLVVKRYKYLAKDTFLLGFAE